MGSDRYHSLRACPVPDTPWHAMWGSSHLILITTRQVLVLYNPQFAAEETGSERLSHLPNITQLRTKSRSGARGLCPGGSRPAGTQRQESDEGSACWQCLKQVAAAERVLCGSRWLRGNTQTFLFKCTEARISFSRAFTIPNADQEKMTIQFEDELLESQSYSCDHWNGILKLKAVSQVYFNSVNFIDNETKLQVDSLKHWQYWP